MRTTYRFQGRTHTVAHRVDVLPADTAIQSLPRISQADQPFHSGYDSAKPPTVPTSSVRRTSGAARTSKLWIQPISHWTPRLPGPSGRFQSTRRRRQRCVAARLTGASNASRSCRRPGRGEIAWTRNYRRQGRGSGGVEAVDDGVPCREIRDRVVDLIRYQSSDRCSPQVAATRTVSGARCPGQRVGFLGVDSGLRRTQTGNSNSQKSSSSRRARPVTTHKRFDLGGLILRWCFDVAGLHIEATFVWRGSYNSKIEGMRTASG